MQMNSHSQWASRGVTFLLAALVAVSAVYWVLKWPETKVAVPVSTPVTPSPSEPQALARLLGGASAEPSVSAPMSHVPSRLVLIGVVAGASGGTALIAVDGKPAKPFRVGRQVEEGLMLQSVAKRQAVLAASVNGPAVLTLELSALSK
jgi:general secretion pathway protein C